jgi:capsular exopolysaccharide synthesis family protein
MDSFEQFLSKEDNKGSFSIYSVFQLIRRYLLWYILCFMLAIAVGFTYMRYANYKYKATSALLIKNEDKGGGLFGSGQPIENLLLASNNNNVHNEIEILKSRNLLERVCDSLNFSKQYYLKGTFKTTNIFRNSPLIIDVLSVVDTSLTVRLTMKHVDANTLEMGDDKKTRFNFGQVIKTPVGVFRINKNEASTLIKNIGNEYIVSYIPRDIATGGLQTSLTIAPTDVQSSVLEMECISDNQELATAILNYTMREYAIINIEDKNLNVKNTLSFIEDRLSLISKDLVDVEKQLQGYKENFKIYNIEAQTTNVALTNSDLSQKIIEQETRYIIAQMMYDYISNKSGIYSLVPSSLGIEDPVLNLLTRQYNELITLRENELKTASTENPSIKRIESDIASKRQSIVENLKNISDSYKITGNQLQAQLNLANADLSTIPRKENVLTDVERQRSIKQNVYQYLLQKREENYIALASSISNSKVISSAFSSKNPVVPAGKLVYSIAGFLGLLIPTILIFLSQVLNDSVTGRDDVQRLTTVPIMGELGHNSEKTTLVIDAQKRSALAEQFRIIRTNLQFMLRDNKSSQTILVTSSMGGEGKSFVSTNVGASMALSDKKTVILEMDLRKPRLIAGLGLDTPAGTGISYILLGKSTVKASLVQLPGFSNAYILPAGILPPNPTELLLSPSTQQLFGELRSQFDIIVIDTAPVGLVTDASILAGFADCSLYVVRNKRTKLHQIKMLNELNESQKFPRLGVIINDIKDKGRHGYYGQGANGYYSDYNSNGTAKTKLKKMLSRFS